MGQTAQEALAAGRISSVDYAQVVVDAQQAKRPEGKPGRKDAAPLRWDPERQRWSASAYYGATLEAAISHIASIARIRRKEGK